MDLIFFWFSYTTLIVTLAFSVPTSRAATFTFANRCDYTVWPGILANAGTPPLETTGFELPSQTSRTLQAPTGWSGRFWGRTGCNFNSGLCSTGDCGSGSLECAGSGAQPPATLAEFTLGTGGQDFYDVSLVDGYNLPMLVEPSTGSNADSCAATGCLADLNRMCPNELRSDNGEACKSACEAFGTPEYCCSGAYGSPATCKPSIYSQVFKSACPRSYSYAYDDATSTFTCSGADYTVTFCPSTPSQKSTTTTPATPATTYPTPAIPNGSEEPDGSGSMSSDGSGSSVGDTGPTGVAGSTGPQTTTMLADGSWLAGLAMGGSTKAASCSVIIMLPIALSLSLVVSFIYHL